MPGVRIEMVEETRNTARGASWSMTELAAWRDEVQAFVARTKQELLEAVQPLCEEPEPERDLPQPAAVPAPEEDVPDAAVSADGTLDRLEMLRRQLTERIRGSESRESAEEEDATSA